MADVNANIGVNLDASSALAQLKALQREIATFHSSVAKSSEAAALAQRDLQRNFINGVNSIGAFSAELRTVKTTAESFTDSLEKNKFSMREYFRYAGASTRSFGKIFRSEFDTIEKVAIENVKRLQTQYIKMGRDASGAMRAIAIMPTELNMQDLATKTQIAAQKQAIFNQLIKQGSTNLLNFGKNTQWAGRQLMVGFTLPLVALGSAATKTFMDMETAAIKFRKVYGDLFTPAAETQQALDTITELGKVFTKYGIAVSDTISLSAEAAAAGFQGLDLQRQTTEATRLQVLGQIDAQKALETTISLQNAFQMQSADLADAINFLNAVENQTVVSLDDITTAIPKAAPVVKQLGGDVKDLAFFMAAMKEGGINASEGANALKSGLASLINPTNKAKTMMAGFGIDIDTIVNKNAGNVKQTVIEFAQALDGLSDLNRQRAIEQLFGKFQLARLSTLFENVTKNGNQASRVLDLANASTEDLAATAEKELGITAESAMNKFRASVEQLKLELAPVGKIFLEVITPFIKNIGDLLEKFNDLSPTTKKVIATLVVGIGGIAPVVLMTIGLFANFVANGVKGLNILRNGYLRLTGQSQILGEQTNYLTVEQQNALAAAHSLDQSHARLIQRFTVEKEAVAQLVNEYRKMIAASGSFAMNFPGAMIPKPKGYKDGIVSVPGPKGAGDVVPAMVSPGEAIISAEMNEKYAPLVQGIIADNIPGFKRGTRGGKFKSVDVPGGYDASHFGGSFQRTGEQLLAMVEGIDTAMANKIRQMVNSFEDGAERSFTVFDNRVVAQLTKINRLMDKKGFANVEEVKQNLVAPGFAETRDLALQKELTDAGMSIEDYKVVNQKITDEITKGFDLLGDKTEITSDELDQLLRTAYDEVAKTDERVRAANDKLKQITTATDPRTSSRIPITEESYTLARKKGEYQSGMEAIIGEENLPYPKYSRFGIKKGAADLLGLSLEQTASVYDQMSKEAKIKLSLLKDDIHKFHAEFIAEAEKAGLKIGEKYKIGIDDNLQDIYVESRQRQSPHPLASKDGSDDGRAYEDARQSAVRERRVATSPGGTVTEGGVIVPTSGGIVDKVDDISNSMEDAAKETAIVSEKMQKFNSRLQAGSFAMMGITSAMSIFGDGTNKVSGFLFKVSTALFAFQSILQVATSELMLNVLANRAVKAGFLTKVVTAEGVKFSRITGLFNGGLTRLLPNLLNFGKIIGRFLGIPGLVIGGFFILKGIIDQINKAKEEERLKVEGLGDAALIAGEKLKGIGEYFGFVPGTFAYETGIGATEGAIPGATAQRTTELQKFVESDAFKKYAPDVASIKTATDKEAQLLLENLAMQLVARGAPQEAVSLIIDAIKQQSGKTDLVIDFKSLDLGSKEGKESLNQNVADMLSMFAKKYSKGVGKEFTRNLRFTARSITGIFGTLQAQMSAGIITAKDYSDQVNNILSGIDKLKPDAQIKLFDQIFASMGGQAQLTAANISNLSDKFLYLQAVILGGQNIPKQITDMLQSSELIQQDMGRRALKKYIEQLYGTTLQNVGGGTTTTNNGPGDGEKLTKKVIDLLNKQVKALEKKRDALKAVNDEIDRQYEYQKRQMDLESQITEAKLSGNYIQAALLTQQKLFEKADFNRETQELAIQAKIDKINERISELENGAKLNAAERRLAGLKGGTGGTGGGGSKESTKKNPDEVIKNYTYQPQTNTRSIQPPTGEELTSWRKRVRKYGPDNAKFVFNTQSKKWEVVAPENIKPYHINYSDFQSGKSSYYTGGSVSGPGTSTSDSIPAYLSDGEYVVNASAVDHYGVGTFDALNAKRFKNGGKANSNSSSYMTSFNPFAMGMEWFGNTIKDSLYNVSKFALGFDPMKPFNKQSNLEKLSMASLLIPGANLGKSGGSAIRAGSTLVDDMLKQGANWTAEGRAFQMAAIDKEAAENLFKMDLSKINLPDSLPSVNVSTAKKAISDRLSRTVKGGIETFSSTDWEVIQALRVMELAKKFPKADLSDVKTFNQLYGKEFYGLVGDPIVKLFKGVRGLDPIKSFTGGWRTGGGLPTYFSTNPYIAATYAMMLGKRTPDNLPMFSANLPMSKLPGYFGEGAVRGNQAQGSMEFPMSLPSSMMSEIASSIKEYSLPGSIMGNWFKVIKDGSLQVKDFWPRFSKGSYVNIDSLPKFENGIDNVPYDMPAILHQNERVLTAEENKNYGQSNTTISPTFNISGGNSDEIVNKIMVKLDTLAKKNNYSNKVGK